MQYIHINVNEFFFSSQAGEVETPQYIIQSSHSYPSPLDCKEGKNKDKNKDKDKDKDKDKKSSILVEVMNAEVVRHPDYEVSLSLRGTSDSSRI